MTDWQAPRRCRLGSADELGDDEVDPRIDALAGERPPDDPLALFERAGARDSAGLEAEAEPLYREALDRGLDGCGARAGAHPARVARSATSARRARPSRCSTRSSPTRATSHDAVVAFRALALVDAGDAAARGIRGADRARPAPAALPRVARGIRRASSARIRLGRTARFACVAPDRFE